MNEYPTIDSDGYLPRNFLCVLIQVGFPDMSRWCSIDLLNRYVYSEKRVERAQGLDTVLFKNLPLPRVS